jgi:hypothetical protein
MSLRSIACLALATLAGCASTAVMQPTAAPTGRTLELEPNAVHEDCRALEAGERLDYRFSATVPLTFRIYYRDGNAVVSPITRERVTADSGIFQAALASNFCLQWEIGLATGTLDYRIGVRPRPR